MFLAINIKGVSSDQWTVNSTAVLATLSDVPCHYVSVPSTRVDYIMVNLIKLCCVDFVGVAHLVNNVEELHGGHGLIIVNLKHR